MATSLPTDMVTSGGLPPPPPPPPSPQEEEEEWGETYDDQFENSEDFKWQIIIQILIPDFAKAFRGFSIQLRDQVASLMSCVERYGAMDNKDMVSASNTKIEEDGWSLSGYVINAYWKLHNGLQLVVKLVNRVENASEMYLPEMIDFLKQNQPVEAKVKAGQLLCLMEDTDQSIITLFQEMAICIENGIEASQHPQLSQYLGIFPHLKEFDRELERLQTFLTSDFCKHWEAMEDIEKYIDQSTAPGRQPSQQPITPSMETMETNQESGEVGEIREGCENLKIMKEKEDDA